jgi:HK97 family phage major capsid protein
MSTTTTTTNQNQSPNYETKTQMTHSTSTDPRLLHIATAIKDDITKHIDNISSNLQQKALEFQHKPYIPQADMLNHEANEYKAAFNQFIRTGNENAIKEMQHKAVSIAGTGAEGGVLVSPQLNEFILTTIKNAEFVQSCHCNKQYR